MISAHFRQIVVMMGTVVIFFFACLLPFKVDYLIMIDDNDVAGDDFDND